MTTETPYFHCFGCGSLMEPHEELFLGVCTTCDQARKASAARAVAKSSKPKQSLLDLVDPAIVAGMLTSLAWLSVLLGVRVNPFFYLGSPVFWGVACLVVMACHPRPLALNMYISFVLALTSVVTVVAFVGA